MGYALQIPGPDDRHDFVAAYERTLARFVFRLVPDCIHRCPIAWKAAVAECQTVAVISDRHIHCSSFC